MPNLEADGIASAVVVAAAVLLALAAVAKLRAPQPTQDLLRGLGLPAGVGLIRTIALLELLSAALAPFGNLATVPLAACYAAFTVVAVRLLTSEPGASCGCFGGTDTPVTALHPILTAAFAVAAIVAVWTPAGWAVLWSHGFTGLVIGAQSLLVAALAYAALAVYPQLVSAR
jgi:hypothetical protein